MVSPLTHPAPHTDDIRLVVLDMAGTTVADGGLVELAFDTAARRMGVEPGTPRHAEQLAYVRATMGESKISVFRHLFADPGGDPRATEEAAQRANRAFETAYDTLVDAGRIAPVPGAREAIEALQAAGRTVVLTTGFARVTQDAILDALGWRDLVARTLCPADAGGRGRPYPDMVLTALLHTGAADDVAQIAVAGDTSYDMIAGRRSGAAVVAGVRTGAHDTAQLRAAGATHVLDSVAELPALLGVV
ncbi:phosphonatase-like hydrolase [Streptomyces noursei]|uniref:phosphonatase-like hydrolase n=1 Tax=Streptomyces noursei TaxID=1971 RepID=UPI001673BC0F|nr:phosphonatase-like hydrolase [Streptomyces noursei]MCZ1015994.1 phosphonatase-like hydrolase [Streptomyces noursei]GGW92249.1 putative haloacid dehalogenase-like hydrolase [Streptomyces noursei]